MMLLNTVYYNFICGVVLDSVWTSVPQAPWRSCRSAYRVTCLIIKSL